MKKTRSGRILLQYLLPATLSLFLLFTIERNVESDGAYDKLYGFPLAFISSNYGFTHHFDVYLLPMLLNLVFYFLITCLYFNLIAGMGVPLKTHWIFILLGIIISLYWIFMFYAISFESSFKWMNDNEYKTLFRKLHFGFFP